MTNTLYLKNIQTDKTVRLTEKGASQILNRPVKRHFFSGGIGIIGDYHLSYDGKFFDDTSYKEVKRKALTDEYETIMGNVKKYYQRKDFNATEDNIQDAFDYTIRQIDKLNCNSVSQAFYNCLRGKILDVKRNRRKDYESLRKGGNRMVQVDTYVKDESGEYRDLLDDTDAKPMWDYGSITCTQGVNDSYKLDCMKNILKSYYDHKVVDAYFHYKLYVKNDRSIPSNRLETYVKSVGLKVKPTRADFKEISKHLNNPEFIEAVLELYESVRFLDFDEMGLNDFIN